MNYTLTNLEDNIKKLYLLLEITKPSEIDIWQFAHYFDIWIEFEESKSELVETQKGLFTICLDKRNSYQNQWQDFAHEFGHVIRHVGKQHKLRSYFRDFQEFQANNFMYHFCVPTFMLFEYNVSNYLDIENGAKFVSTTFNVTEEFAKKRMILFRDKLLQAKLDDEHRKYMESRYPKAPPYSPETNNIVKRALELKANNERKKQHA
ncbi:ImmA/IrrE family metallo-endopeptidase [Cytobacillus kochii]|uniref:ImmA/IrrE family metallo-endopeptidase n=1 Tax=Cytobacillus kochii TaxID=859143 RepID=UPI002E1B7057|nr:ImmA/IrrE family metallo-endopeptidase [Cytobacillus kochii]